MRKMLFAATVLIATGTAEAKDPLPDLTRCRNIRIDRALINACVKVAESALNHPRSGELSASQRSLALTWRALAETGRKNRQTEELSEEGERLMEEARRLDPRNAMAFLLAADSEISKARFASAEALLTAGRKIAPKNPLADIVLARLLLRKGDFDGARKAYTVVIAGHPSMPEIHFGRAAAHLGLNNVDAARADLRKGMANAARDSGLFLRAIRAARELKMEKDALPAIDAYLKTNANADVQYAKGEILFDAKDYKGAYEALTEALFVNPGSVNTFILRGRSAFLLKQTDHALIDLEQAEKLAPKDARIFYWRAIAYRDLDRPDDAMAEIGKAIELNPKDPSLWSQRGWLFDKRSNYSAAADDYAKAIALNPGNKVYLNNYGTVLEALGRLEAAETAYRSSLSLDPTYIYPARNLVNIFGKMHEKSPDLALKAKGQEALDRLLKLEPDDKENLRRAGLFYKRVRDWEKAAENLKAYDEWKPGDLSVLTDLGFCLSNLGRHAEVVPVLEKAIALSPNHAGNLNNLGWSKFKLGDPAMGLELSERSLKLRPGDPPTLNTRAHAKAALGDREGAIKDHREAIRLAKPGAPVIADSTNALKELGETP